MSEQATFIRWFNELGVGDVALVGGKNASLGEMYRELTKIDVKVPDGFAVTAAAYRAIVAQAGLEERMHALLDDIDKRDLEDFARRGRQLRDLLYSAPLPAGLEDAIIAAYRQMEEKYGAHLDVAVRSSATAEDLPTASFAGQHDTYLNIHSERQLVDAYKRCVASLFTDRAISYRMDNGFDHFQVALSVGVQRMVRSDLSSSGVMFSLDTESGFRDAVFITGAWGLGENVVQGAVDPDEFYVHKPTFETGHRTVLRRALGAKQIKMVYAEGGAREPVRNVPTSADEQAAYCINDADVLILADYAIKTEKHYSAKAGHPMPMDMEWAKDGRTGELFLIQARPETVTARRSGTVIEEYRLNGAGELAATGRAVGQKIAAGPVRVVRSAAELPSFQDGEVLVADTTTPDWEPVMKRAAAIITNRGGRTCHAAIVARELGIPAVVGAEGATRDLAGIGPVTVSCAEGDTGRVYKGALDFSVETTDLEGLERPRTDIMINLGNPDLAFQTSFIPNDGVGLARMEFIVTESIRAHPMALLDPSAVTDPAERAEIERLIGNHADGAAFFVEKLSEEVGTIAAAFWPKPVILRTSDFKTNEYAALLGGSQFEPEEANPMIGFRGASRYAHPLYEPGFALECQAIRRVREEMGLTNLKVMIPFVRRIDEARAVLDTMARHGLERGKEGLEIYVMCEIPNNVILIDRFAELFDGFSIGSNDLTQLALGVDRDSETVAFDYEERDEGVLELIRLAVEGAKRNGRHSGMCGQAPSDYPEIAEFLVRCGIDSMSLTPDSVLKTTTRVLEIERELDAAEKKSA